MGRRQGQDQIPGTLSRALPPGRPAPLQGVARRLLDLYADRLPDLSGVVVLVPNHRAGLDFARALAREAGRAALVAPQITPLKAWAESFADAATEPQARRLARLHAALRHSDWLGSVDKWALANELLRLIDELSAARSPGATGQPVLGLPPDVSPEREVALIEAVWRTLNASGDDPQARYAAALDALAADIARAPRPIFGFALGPLSGVEQAFLARCADHAPVTLYEGDADDPVAFTLRHAWLATEPPLQARATALATRFADSPVAERITLAPAPHLEAEARAVASWVAAQLRAGRQALALIALDRETARRVRALLERLDVLVADETGWALSTTVAAAVVDRWLECVASDFPHVELLDLLKSPFVLGDLAARQDEVLQLELALRRQRVSQGAADVERVARQEFAALPAWLASLFDARQRFARTAAPLARWLQRLGDSLDQLAARAPLEADAAGARVLETLAALGRDLAQDTEKYDFNEWRRWLGLALESASFVDAGVDSPIVLTSLPAARGRRFDAVAVIGADARHLPALPTPGLFSQATRRQLGLRTSADDAADAITDLIALLAQGPSLLSWRAWNDDEPNPASALVLRLQAMHLAAWGSPLPEQHVGEPPARASTLPGRCVRPAPVVRPAYLPRRYSPTTYQTLLDCPYHFFARAVLGIRELDEADDALDKSDYGNALHRILKRFHDGDPTHDRAQALALLEACAAAEFATLPAYTAAAWHSRWSAIEPAYVDAWLEWVGDGWRHASSESEFSVAVAVAGLGDVTLHGRVDRVDRRGEALAVIDYKTGSAQGLKKKLRMPDEAVQLPFYAWLCNARAAYLPINEAPVAPLELDGETDVEAIGRRLPELLAALAAGAPLPASGVDADCRYCAVRGLCRKGMWHA